MPVNADGCAPPPPQCQQPSPPPPQLRVDKKRTPGTLTAEEYGCNLKNGAWVPVTPSSSVRLAFSVST